MEHPSVHPDGPKPSEAPPRLSSEGPPTVGSRAPLLVGLGLALAGIGLVVVLSLTDAEQAVRGWLVPLGPWGVALFLAVYMAWSFTTVPAIPLMVLAGLLYGPWLGTLYCSVGAVTTHVFTFQMGRRFGKGLLERQASRHPPVAHVAGLVDRHPVLVVALIRLAPVFPLTLLNYGLGATRMRLRTYLWSSLMLSIPGIAVYAGLGHVLRVALVEGRFGLQGILWVVGFAALALALVVAVRRHSARLTGAEGRGGAEGPGGPDGRGGAEGRGGPDGRGGADADGAETKANGRAEAALPSQSPDRGRAPTRRSPRP